MHVRTANLDDIEQLYQATIHMLDAEDAVAKPLLQGEFISIRTRREDLHESARQAITKNVDDSKYQFFVAEEDGKILGYAICSLLDTENLELWFVKTTIGKVNALLVIPDYRGKGVSTLLHDACLEWMHSQGCKYSCLNVFTTNPAKDIYKKWGYETTMENMYKKL